MEIHKKEFISKVLNMWTNIALDTSRLILKIWNRIDISDLWIYDYGIIK